LTLENIIDIIWGRDHTEDASCNSAKKLIFFKKKVATPSLKITVPLIL